jgi:RimJ/RimL family protein N-acetyltransferase
LTESISVTDGRVTIRPARERLLDLHCSSTTAPLRGHFAEGLRPDGRASWIVAGDEIVGSVSYATGPARLDCAEVTVRYRVGASPDDADYAFRAVKLLLHHLATRTSYRTATLRVQPADARAASMAVAAGFALRDSRGGWQIFSREVPPLTYADGVVAIRQQRTEDIDKHLEAIDAQQIDWLWEPGDRQKWEALSPAHRRARNLSHLQACHDSFGNGPKWTFSVDIADAYYVAYVDCDLANNNVPAGEANISYTAHPAHRGHGYVSRAVRLLTQFLRDHTGARLAYVIVDAQNPASVRVADAVGAAESGRWENEHGRTMIRHVLALR